MKLLTQKNFEKLPEIKSKKEEEKRLGELKARKAQAVQYAKELDARRRALITKKKSSKIGFNNVTLPTSEQDWTLLIWIHHRLLTNFTLPDLK